MGSSVSYPKKRQAAKKPPRSRAPLYIAAGSAAALVVAALVIISLLGNTKSAAPASSTLLGIADSSSLFTGIPQHGNVVGSPKAPVTLVEYADLQCPYCGEFSRNALPTLVQQYVRSGKVKLEFRGLAFVGQESDVALRAALAAGAQNRLWIFIHLVYENQGTENTGWVTDSFIRSVANGVGGVDVSRLLTDSQSAAVTGKIDAAQQLATNDGVNSTPTFFVGRTGGALTKLDVASLDPAAFRPTLDGLLHG
jgi:protein-disulfide isomerase